MIGREPVASTQLTLGQRGDIHLRIEEKDSAICLYFSGNVSKFHCAFDQEGDTHWSNNSNKNFQSDSECTQEVYIETASGGISDNEERPVPTSVQLWFLFLSYYEPIFVQYWCRGLPSAVSDSSILSLPTTEELPTSDDEFPHVESTQRNTFDLKNIESFQMLLMYIMPQIVPPVRTLAPVNVGMLCDKTFLNKTDDESKDPNNSTIVICEKTRGDVGRGTGQKSSITIKPEKEMGNDSCIEGIYLDSKHIAETLHSEIRNEVQKLQTRKTEVLSSCSPGRPIRLNEAVRFGVQDSMSDNEISCPGEHTALSVICGAHKEAQTHTTSQPQELYNNSIPEVSAVETSPLTKFRDTQFKGEESDVDEETLERDGVACRSATNTKLLRGGKCPQYFRQEMQNHQDMYHRCPTIPRTICTRDCQHYRQRSQRKKKSPATSRRDRLRFNRWKNGAQRHQPTEAKKDWSISGHDNPADDNHISSGLDPRPSHQSANTTRGIDKDEKLPSIQRRTPGTSRFAPDHSKPPFHFRHSAPSPTNMAANRSKSKHVRKSPTIHSQPSSDNVQNKPHFYPGKLHNTTLKLPDSRTSGQEITKKLKTGFRTQYQSEEVHVPSVNDCTACIGVLLESSGHTNVTSRRKKQNILISLMPHSSYFSAKTVIGLAEVLLPNLTGMDLQHICSVSQRNFHETCVHILVKEMKTEGLRLAHLVDYFRGDNNKRVDVLRDIREIHSGCPFCDSVFQQFC